MKTRSGAIKTEQTCVFCLDNTRDLLTCAKCAKASTCVECLLDDGYIFNLKCDHCSAEMFAELLGHGKKTRNKLLAALYRLAVLRAEELAGATSDWAVRGQLVKRHHGTKSVEFETHRSDVLMDEHYDGSARSFVGDVFSDRSCPACVRGKQTTNGTCADCGSAECPECGVITGGEKHTCKKQDIESIAKVKESTKPCPRCNSPIMKGAGCNDMHCTKCGKSFDWKEADGHAVVRLRHNPHRDIRLRESIFPGVGYAPVDMAIPDPLFPVAAVPGFQDVIEFAWLEYDAQRWASSALDVRVDLASGFPVERMLFATFVRELAMRYLTKLLCGFIQTVNEAWKRHEPEISTRQVDIPPHLLSHARTTEFFRRLGPGQNVVVDFRAEVTTYSAVFAATATEEVRKISLAFGTFIRAVLVYTKEHYLPGLRLVTYQVKNKLSILTGGMGRLNQTHGKLLAPEMIGDWVVYLNK